MTAEMTSATAAKARWLDAVRPFIRANLPAAPGVVVEIGCGDAGGFVPMMREQGHHAVGVDPVAPSGAGYHAVDFERYAPTGPVDTIVACASLHHVGDVQAVLDRARSFLAPGGSIVVVEWAYENFDEATARWCFERLPESDDPGWLHHHRREWQASGQSWPDYRDAWATSERLHAGKAMIEALRARFGTRSLSRTPYFFPDLYPTSESEERAAASAGEIQATGIRYVGNTPGG